MNTYWFKPKRYGYGATPVTWEGWAATGIAIAIIMIASVMVSDPSRVTPAGWFIWAATIGLTVAVLWIISVRKTEGAWRWGNEPD